MSRTPGPRVLVLVVLAVACLAAADGVRGEVRIDDTTTVHLTVTPETVAPGEHAVATAVARGIPAVRSVVIELHVPDGTTVRPRSSREVRRPRSEVEQHWRVCRDVPGDIGLAASVAWDDPHGGSRTVVSDTVVLHVTPDIGRPCGGRP